MLFATLLRCVVWCGRMAMIDSAGRWHRIRDDSMTRLVIRLTRGHMGTRLALNPKLFIGRYVEKLRWSRPVGQFSGRVKLGPGCRQAASLSVTLAPYASSGVRPANVE